MFEIAFVFFAAGERVAQSIGGADAGCLGLLAAIFDFHGVTGSRSAGTLGFFSTSSIECISLEFNGLGKSGTFS